jgi:DNA-binding XRE family transcriptional regulator
LGGAKMSGFDKDDFGAKILSMYSEAKDNNYILKLDSERVDELKGIYKETCIPPDKLEQYTEEEITKKMMTAIVSVYDKDEDGTGNSEVVELVNTVKYDGRNMYLEYAKISSVRMRRIELGKTRKEVADVIGYSVSAVRNCESIVCDLTRQPSVLVEKLARALDCEPEVLL